MTDTNNTIAKEMVKNAAAAPATSEQQEDKIMRKMKRERFTELFKLYDVAEQVQIIQSFKAIAQQSVKDAQAAVDKL